MGRTVVRSSDDGGWRRRLVPRLASRPQRSASVSPAVQSSIRAPVGCPLVSTSIPTVWVFGDQLDRSRGALAGRMPGDCRVLFVESETLITSRRWHRQRLHLVLSAMAHFAAELRVEGFEVDHRRARTLGQGLRDHVAEFGTRRVIAMEPTSWDARVELERLGVELVRNDLFLCHYDDFAELGAGRKRLTMEDFYRWQRLRLGVLMDVGADGPEPVGGNGTSIMTTANRRRVMAAPGRRSSGSSSTTSTETFSIACRPPRSVPTPLARGRSPERRRSSV